MNAKQTLSNDIDRAMELLQQAKDLLSEATMVIESSELDDADQDDLRKIQEHGRHCEYNRGMQLVEKAIQKLKNI